MLWRVGLMTACTCVALIIISSGSSSAVVHLCKLFPGGVRLALGGC